MNGAINFITHGRLIDYRKMYYENFVLIYWTLIQSHNGEYHRMILLPCNHKASILFICLLQNITFYYFLYITLPDNFFSHEIHGRNEVMIQRCTNSDIEYWPVKYYLMVYWKPTPLKFCMLTITRQNIVTAEMSGYLRCFHFHKWIWIHIASRRTSLCLRQTKQEVCSRPSFR